LLPQQHNRRRIRRRRRTSPTPTGRRVGFRILSEFSTFVEVPVEHLGNGVAPDIRYSVSDANPPFQVCSSPQKPPDAFAAVRYETNSF
jgi:hypothetical protein